MIKLGILGAGHIAGKMAKTANMIGETGYTAVQNYAVASRDVEKAKSFASEYNIPKFYGSYEEMLADPEVSLVYIATPHSHHYQHARMCLEAGKHVLCEKAFTVNEAQARALFDLARKKHLMIAEAIWTRYMPWRQQVVDLVADSDLGKPRMITANLCYPVSNNERIKQPMLAGGALLDLGVYLLNFALMITEKQPTRVIASCQKNELGVDFYDSYTLYFGDNEPVANMCCNVCTSSDRRGIIYCDNGYMEIDNVNCPQKVVLYDNFHEVLQTIDCPVMFTGFEYELLAAADAIEEGKVESVYMPHNESLYMMHLMDEIRRQMDVKYPDEIESL